MYIPFRIGLFLMAGILGDTVCHADTQTDAVLHVEGYSYTGMDRPGWNTHMQKPYGRAAKMVLPVEKELLKVTMIPGWTEDGTAIELMLEIAEVEAAFGVDPEADNARIQELLKQRSYKLMAEESLLIPWDASQRVQIGDIAFKVACPRVELKKPVVFPEVRDEIGNSIRGTVRVQAYIDGNGKVYQTVVSRSDDDRLNAAAKEAVYNAAFHPIVIDGKPISTSYTITADFGQSG